MEYIKPPVVRFMAKYQRYEPTVRDSTAVMSAKTCKRLYFLERVSGFVPKETQPYFSFGSCYHKFREILEKSHMEGKPEAECLKLALDASGKMWKKIGADPPVGTRWEFLTGKRLFASCMAAFEWWKNEKKQGRIIVVAVEQIWQVFLKDGITLIGGRADQITKFNGKLWGRDWKTSSKMGKFYDRTLEPNDQFTRYTLGEGKLKGEQVQGQLVEVMYNTAKEGPKIVPLITSRTLEQLENWEDDQIFYEKILALCRNEDRYPMEEKHCPFCKFHSVCKMPTEGAMMAQLDSNYVQRPWDFYKVNQESED